MIKKIIILLLFITSVAHAQYSIKGTMTPPEKGDWVALYRIEGAKQVYINKDTIKTTSFDVGGTKQEIGTFEFTLPKDSKSGAYRAQYRQEGGGFVDFIFNNEDVEMVFNPQYPDQSILFSKSLENRVYREYRESQTLIQTKIDSLQVSFLALPTKGTKKAYKKQISLLKDTQKMFENKSGGMFVNIFIKSSKVDNASSPSSNSKEYRSHVRSNYFNNVDFNNKRLIYSPFLINLIGDYIFYLDIADRQDLQQKMYKESIKEVMKRSSSEELTQMFCEYLISTFSDKRNSEIVDWMFSEYYDKLSVSDNTIAFKARILEALQVSVGREAPDFTWKDDGISKSLASLSDGEKYLLVFWSTTCSHCIEEIPELHKALEGRKDISVVAIAIEDNDLDFNSWKKNKLYNFHNVLAGDGFKNKTVQDYMIEETPTYFILDKAKEIIAVPNAIKDVKDYFKLK